MLLPVRVPDGYKHAHGVAQNYCYTVFTMEYPPYIAPILTVDSVVMQLQGNKLAVLLIKRARDPFKGVWALPGGYDPAGETTTQALARILKTKAGLDASGLQLDQLHTFDTVGRDPRGHAVTVTYMGLGKDITLDVSSNTVENPAFFPIDALPQLAYDHDQIITYARQRLRSKLTHTTAISALLPQKFTLTELQQAYEAVLGHALDKRNFRKKLLASGFIEPTGVFAKDGPHRPAQLYTFCEPSPFFTAD